MIASPPRYKRSIACKKATSKIDEAPMVLVVDDDPSARSGLTRLLRASGFRVQSFDRPTALLAAEIPSRNACLVVDVNLPEMNGIELCERLAESSRGLPVILITGQTDERTRRLTERAHAIAVLFKPINERPLLDAIGHALALSRVVRSQN